MKSILSHKAKDLSKETPDAATLLSGPTFGIECGHGRFTGGRKIVRVFGRPRKPDRVGAVHDLLRVHLWDKCRISLHAGKTKVWNKSGTYPPDCARLQRAATDVSPEAVVVERRRPFAP